MSNILDEMLIGDKFEVSCKKISFKENNGIHLNGKPTCEIIKETKEAAYIQTKFNGLCETIFYKKDNSIPHAFASAVDEFLNEVISRAKKIDGVKKSITLRLRSMGGIIRMAGDFAVAKNKDLIEKIDIKEAIKKSGNKNYFI